MAVGGSTTLTSVHGRESTIVLKGLIAPELLEGVQRAALADDPLSEFLAVVSAAGVRAVPAFAYIGPEGGDVRLLVRGDLEVSVALLDGSTSKVDARGVTTWTETLMPSTASVSVGSDAGRVVVVLGAVPTGGPTKPHAPDVPAHVDERTATETTAVEPALTLPPVALASEVDDPVAIDSLAPTGAQQTASAADDADEESFEFTNLFETRFTGVEAAAVRDDSADEGVHADVVDDVTEEPPPQVASGPIVAVEPPSPPSTGLIASVPSITHAPASAAAAPDVQAATSPGDHDGMTISASELAAARAEHVRTVGGATVHAVRCEGGHLNPPHASQCRACGRPITDHTITTVSRPTLGRLQFDSGMVVDVDRPLVIGRKPSADPALAGDEVPGLVTLPDPESSLSRVHAEVRLDGWEVMVVDRDSKNGTFVALPGQAPVMLRPHAPLPIVSGTRISFGDVTSCMFQVGN